jgi:aminoglycoside phosphotransferase (APT) family kinase protein
MERPAARLERLAERYIPGSGPVQIERLGSGLVNESYRVAREGRVFCLRMAAPRAGELGLDRGWECRVLRCAAGAGLAPAVERCEPRAGVLVTRWVEGSAWTAEQASSPESLATVAMLVQRVNALPLVHRPRIVSPAQWIGLYRRALGRVGDGACSEPPDQNRAGLDAVAQSVIDALAQEPPAARALCHGDLHVQNLLTPAQSKPLILDWEYAHVSDPQWDLAGWACNADLTDRCRDLLLRLYLDREPSRGEAVRLGRMAWLYDYICLLWSELYLSSRAPDPASEAVSMRARRLLERLRATGCAGQVPAH